MRVWHRSVVCADGQVLFEDEEWEAVQGTRPDEEVGMPIPFRSSSVEPTRPRSAAEPLSPSSAAHADA